MNLIYTPLAFDYTALSIPLSLLILSIPIEGKSNTVSHEIKKNKSPYIIQMVGKIVNRKMMESALLFNLQQGSSNDGSYFKDAAQYLSGLLDMEYVCICKTDEEGCAPLALYYNGEFKKDACCKDKCCAGPRNINTCFYGNDVQKLFPNNLLFQRLKAESYINICLTDNSGKRVGTLTMISKKPRYNIRPIEFTVELIGLRIAVEIQRIKAEKTIQESEEKYRLLVTRMSQSLAVFDVSQDRNKEFVYTLIDVNSSFEKLIGLNKDEIYGKNIYDVLPDMKYCDKHQLAESVRKGTDLKIEAYFKKFKRYFEILIYSPKPNQLAAVLSDITSRKKREEEIIYISNHDCVTKLYNRTFFETEKKRLDTARQLPLSVIIGDINGLKLTNDIFGHDEGDNLLIKISEILTENCRNDDIVARIGGDEFGILLPKTNEKDAQKFCKRIVQAVQEYEVNLDTPSIYPGISLGYATKTNENDSLERVIRCAESFMYRKKLTHKKENLDILMSSIKNIMLERTCETADHIDRLVNLSNSLGMALNLSSEDLENLELVSVFHDIGKMNVDNYILSKNGRLSENEMTELKKYPEVGYRIALATPDLLPVADYILCSHEKWDGSGYPQKLAGEQIPLLSRVFSVVNAYEAMTQDRPYRKALSQEQAIEEIRKQAGTHFDPYIAKTFIRLISDIPTDIHSSKTTA